MNLVYERMNEVFEKWHIIGLPFDASFNHFSGLETGDPHSHPFSFTSHVLSGGYVERIFNLDGTYKDIVRAPGDTFTNSAEHIHLIIALPQGKCWTLMRPNPHTQSTRFYQFRDGAVVSRDWSDPEFT